MASAHGGTGYRWRTFAGLGGALALAAIPAGASAEEPAVGCPVVATAQGLQVTVSSSDNILLTAPAGAGVPVAQACVDYAVRDSAAFASSPYPGETVILAPGLINNQIGESGPQVPPYPAYAASRYPAREHSEQNGNGYALRSDSGETSSSARARSALAPEDGGGGDSTLTTASVAVDPTVGTATSKATSDTQPFTVNDVLQLGRVSSLAAVTIGRDGEPDLASDLRIGHTTVGGQEVVITPDGVKAAGETTAIPQPPPTDVLEQAGVTVRYLPVDRTANGVLSAGVEITARQEDPESGSVTTVRYTLGRSFAAAAPPEAQAALPSVDVPQPPAAPSPPAAADAPPPGGSGVGDALSPDASAPGVAPEAPPAVIAGAAPQQLAGRPVDIGVAGSYVVLAFGALVMFATGMLLRLLGVKTRWTS